MTERYVRITPAERADVLEALGRALAQRQGRQYLERGPTDVGMVPDTVGPGRFPAGLDRETPWAQLTPAQQARVRLQPYAVEILPLTDGSADYYLALDSAELAAYEGRAVTLRGGRPYRLQLQSRADDQYPPRASPPQPGGGGGQQGGEQGGGRP